MIVNQVCVIELNFEWKNEARSAKQSAKFKYTFKIFLLKPQNVHSIENVQFCLPVLISNFISNMHFKSCGDNLTGIELRKGL